MGLTLIQEIFIYSVRILDVELNVQLVKPNFRYGFNEQWRMQATSVSLLARCYSSLSRCCLSALEQIFEA